MYMGRIVEHGPAAEVASNPAHPYTQALMSAVPGADPTNRRLSERIRLTGPQPNPTALPSGCRFQTRCPHVMPICAEIDPPLVEAATGQYAACHLIIGSSSSTAVRVSNVNSV